MNNANYILIAVLFIFFSYRFYRFFSIKKKIPNLLKAGAIIVDVRSREEFRAQSNPESTNIPLDRLSKECENLDQSKMIILCCASGGRSGQAMGILKNKGFEHVMNAGPWTNTLVT